MSFEDLIGKNIIVVSSSLTTPPDRRLFYLAGTVAEISGPMMKMTGCKFTHAEDKVWTLSFPDLMKQTYMRPAGINGSCWLCYTAMNLRIYPFD